MKRVNQSSPLELRDDNPSKQQKTEEILAQPTILFKPLKQAQKEQKEQIITIYKDQLKTKPNEQK